MTHHEQNASASPYFDARLDQWAARDYWTPSESAAVSLGKHPWSLNDDRSKDHLDSWYTLEFWERRDLFIRAAEVGRIPRKCPPNKALELLKQRGIPFVAGLEEAVSRFHPVINWEQGFCAVLKWVKENQHQLADHKAALEAAQRDSSDFAVWQAKAHALIEELIAENDAVTARLEEMEAAVGSVAAPETAAANDNAIEKLSPKERYSKDIMLAAMAIEGYAFDPASPKSKIGSEIAEDAAKLGLELTPPVASKHIRDACKRLRIEKRPDADG